MNLLKVVFLLTSVLFAFSAHAERGIAEIFQPTSLLGTDTEDEPLKDGQTMAATILCQADSDSRRISRISSYGNVLAA